MNKLFRGYVISISIVILGQLIYASFASNILYYLLSILFIIFLFTISLKPELMENKEFLFSQLVLAATFFIYTLISSPVIYAFTGGVELKGFSFDSLILIGDILKLSGYALSILCLIKYNLPKKQEVQ